MKRILIFLLLLSGVAYGQMPIVPGYTSVNSKYIWYGGGFQQLTLPAYGDTALVSGQWKRAGAVLVDTTGSNKGIYVYYDGYWHQVGMGGAGVTDGDKGAITVSGTGSVWNINNNAVTTSKINNGAVTLSKIEDLQTARIIGRVTGSTGVPESLTGTQVTTMLDQFTTSLKGLVPASGGGTSNYLRADGTWATPPGGGSGTDNAPIGSGFKILKPSTQEIKSIFNGYGVTWDSTSNTNGLTPTIDTSSGGVRTALNSYNKSQINTFFNGDSLQTITGRGNTTYSIRYLQSSVLNEPSAWERYGDSYTDGGDNASADSAYFEHLAPFWGLTSTNRASAGRGTYQMVSTHMANINPGHSKLTTLYSGQNDYGRGGSARKTLNKIINSYKAAFVNQFLASYTEAGAVSASITKSAGFSTGYNPNTVGGKSGTGAYTQTSGDTISYQFSGKTNVAWQMIGGDSTNVSYAHGNWKIYEVGGSLVATSDFGTNQQFDGISDGSNNNQQGPIAFYYLGLDATKTYRLTLTSRQSTNLFAADYFGHLVDLGSAYAQIWIQPVYLTSAGYALYAASPTDATVDAVKAVMDSVYNVVATTGYPVFLVETNTGWNTVTMMAGDGAHPNDLGHRTIYEKVAAVMPELVDVPAEGTIVRTGSGSNTHWYGSNGTTLLQLDGGGSSSGGLLAGQGLTDSTGYMINTLWKGTAGGGWVRGGTGSGENLQLISTAHATKGKIVAGILTIDEANGYIGINKSAPATAMLDMISSGVGNYGIRMKAAASQTQHMLSIINSSDVSMFNVGPQGGLSVMGALTSFPAAGVHISYSSSVGYIDWYNGSAGQTGQLRFGSLGLRAGSGVNINAMDVATTGAITINEGGVAINTRIEGDADANLVLVDGTNDRVGLGIAAPDRKLHVLQSDAVTSAITYALKVDHLTSGTAAVGSGVGIELSTENASGNQKVTSTIESPLLTATNGSEDADIVLKTILDGTLTEIGRFKAEGGFRGRITPRVTSISSSATPTPNADTDDYFKVTALATNPTFAAPTGTVYDGQIIIIYIKDDGTPRTLSWNAIYRAGDIPLPTTTTANKVMKIQVQFDQGATRWDLIGLVDNL